MHQFITQFPTTMLVVALCITAPIAMYVVTRAVTFVWMGIALRSVSPKARSRLSRAISFASAIDMGLAAVAYSLVALSLYATHQVLHLHLWATAGIFLAEIIVLGWIYRLIKPSLVRLTGVSIDRIFSDRLSDNYGRFLKIKGQFVAD